jgi:hypothetical protein
VLLIKLIITKKEFNTNMEVYIASKKGLKISLALLGIYVTNEPDPLHAFSVKYR